MLSKLLTSSFLDMRSASSAFLLAENEPLLSKISIPDIAGTIVGTLGELIYFVIKWMLYLVDIIFFYMQELCGLNIDTTSLETLISRDSDMVFKFLLSDTIDIARIVRQLIGMAIVLIIVFTVIAIIRNQYNAIKSGQADGGPMPVLRTAFKALLVMVVTPMITIVGIVASNLLLKSLYNATNVSGSVSMGAKVFSISSNTSNLYRQYAQNDVRIPITFDFSQEEEVLEAYKNATISSSMAEYLTSTENSIYATYLMFNDKNFTKFSSLSVDKVDDLNNYHILYDSKVNVSDTDPLKEYKRIRAYREEYYVMGDVIDFAINTSTTMYFRTIEEVLDSITKLPAATATSIIADMSALFDIKLVSNTTTSLSYNDYINVEWKRLKFSSDYYKADDYGNPTSRLQIEYNHVAGASDEANGAVYLMAIEKNVIVDDVTYTYFYPLTRDYSKNNDGYGLDSDYILRNQIIVAKGIFNEDKYPTAIRKSKDGSEIQFYRDGLESVALGDAGNFLNTEYIEQESEGGVAGVLNSIIKFFKKLFDPKQWIPNFTYKEDSVMTSYSKITKQANSLADGKLSIGYLFSDSLTSKLSGGIYGLKLYNLFNPLNINYLAFAMGGLILLKTSMILIFALIKRIFDLFLIIIVYPVTCATMPFDNGSAYSAWMSKYVSKLFLTYGMVLGINFVFMLFPAIESLEIFKPEDLTANKVVARFSGLLTWLASVEQQTKILNLAMCLIFQLVLFTFLEGGAAAVISKIVLPDEKENNLYADNAMGQMMQTMMQGGQIIGKISPLFAPVKFLFSKNKIQQIKAKVKGHAPGSALFKAGKEKMDKMTKKKERDEAFKDLKGALGQATGPGGAMAMDKVEQGLNKIKKSF